MEFLEAYKRMKEGDVFIVPGFGEVFIRKTESLQLMCNSPGRPIHLADRLPDGAIKGLIEEHFTYVGTYKEIILKGMNSNENL